MYGRVERQYGIPNPSPIWNKGVGVQHFDEIVAYRQRMTPRSDVLFESVSRIQPEPHSRFHPGHRFRAIRGKPNGGLALEELRLITDWVNGGMPRGNNSRALPEVPESHNPSPSEVSPDAVVVSGELTIERPLTLDGLLPRKVPDGNSVEIIAVLPNLNILPLVWLYNYDERYAHPFLFRDPRDLPAGTVIRGVLGDTEILLLPRKKVGISEWRTHWHRRLAIYFGSLLD